MDEDDFERNEIRFLREVMPGDPGYVRPVAVEGKPLERKTMTVREAIDQLSKHDPDAIVVTVDGEYGTQFETGIRASALERFEFGTWEAQEYGLQVGQPIVRIEG